MEGCPYASALSRRVPPAGDRGGPDREKPVAKVAADLGIAATSAWVAEAGRHRRGLREGLTADERAELVRLRREPRTAQMEKEILRRAAAYFAGKTCGPKVDLTAVARACPDLPAAAGPGDAGVDVGVLRVACRTRADQGPRRHLPRQHHRRDPDHEPSHVRRATGPRRTAARPGRALLPERVRA